MTPYKPKKLAKPDPVEVLQRLVDMYIGDHPGFISCITPQHRCDAPRDSRYWKVWDDARNVLASQVKARKA